MIENKKKIFKYSGVYLSLLNLNREPLLPPILFEFREKFQNWKVRDADVIWRYCWCNLP